MNGKKARVDFAPLDDLPSIRLSYTRSTPQSPFPASKLTLALTRPPNRPQSLPFLSP
jgi:hypothetical protein